MSFVVLKQQKNNKFLKNVVFLKNKCCICDKKGLN